jgi:hypothetical protein
MDSTEKELKTTRIVDFRTGMSSQPLPEEFTNLQDVQPRKDGQITSRPKISTYATLTGGKVTSLYKYLDDHGSPQFIAAVGSTAWNIIDPLRPVSIGAIPSNRHWTYLPCGNYILMACGDGNIKKCNGATITDVPDTPNVAFIQGIDEIVYGGGMGSPSGTDFLYWNTLRYANTDDELTWPGINYVNMEKSSSFLSGLNSLTSNLVIFTLRDIWFMMQSGVPNTAYLQRAYTIGCQFPYSISVWRDNIFFLASDGLVYVLSGSGLNLLSDSVKELMCTTGTAFTTVTNPYDNITASEVHGVAVEDWYLLFFNDILWAFNTKNKPGTATNLAYTTTSVFKWKLPESICCIMRDTSENTTGNLYRVFFGGTSGKVYVLYPEQLETSLTGIIETGPIYGDGCEWEKSVEKVTIIGSGTHGEVDFVSPTRGVIKLSDGGTMPNRIDLPPGCVDTEFTIRVAFAESFTLREINTVHVNMREV